MSENASSPVDSAATPPRLVAIISRNRVIEIWRVYLQNTSWKERETELPTELRTAFVNGERIRHHMYRRQLHRQQWGRFTIYRYQATRILPWTPSIGLAMLIPGTLLAAGSAHQGILQVPVSWLLLQSALIIFGSLAAIGSGWRILTHRVHLARGSPVESLGVSGHALGFPADVSASDALPAGFRAARFRGSVDVDIALSDWKLAEEYTSDLGWLPAR